MSGIWDGNYPGTVILCILIQSGIILWHLLSAFFLVCPFSHFPLSLPAQGDVNGLSNERQWIKTTRRCWAAHLTIWNILKNSGRSEGKAKTSLDYEEIHWRFLCTGTAFRSFRDCTQIIWAEESRGAMIPFYPIFLSKLYLMFVVYYYICVCY